MSNQSHRTFTLDELLTVEQISKVTAILNSEGNDTEKCNALKVYLSEFRSQLLAKGVVIDFLAYVIVHRIYGGQNGHTNLILGGD